MADQASPAKGRALGNVLVGFAMLAICLLASSVRLFSVIKYESVIHEFVSGGCLRSCERVD